MHIYYYNRDNASRSTILNVFNQTPLLFKGRKKLEWKKYSIERCEKYKTYNKQVKSYIHIQHFHRERRLTSPVFGFIFSLIFFLDTFLWNFHLVSLKSFSQRDTLKATLMFANYSLIFTININSSLDLLKNLFYFVRNILCYKCKKSIYYDNNNMQMHRRQSEKSVIVKN